MSRLDAHRQRNTHTSVPMPTNIHVWRCTMGEGTLTKQQTLISTHASNETYLRMPSLQRLTNECVCEDRIRMTRAHHAHIHLCTMCSLDVICTFICIRCAQSTLHATSFIQDVLSSHDVYQIDDITSMTPQHKSCALQWTPDRQETHA